MGKLLFFDIDGTLCMPGAAPSQRTVNAIRSARAKGHHVFLSTGRNIPGIPAPVDAIGFDGYISNAGACAQVGDTPLLDKPLPRYLLDRALDSFRHYDSCYILQGSRGNYGDFRHQQQLAPYFPVQAAGHLMDLQTRLGVQDIVCCQGAPIYKICFFTPDEARFQAIRLLLEREFDFTLFDNLFPDLDAVCGEVNRKGTDKGEALRAICRHYGQGPEDAIAFGDSTNDSAMLLAAGLGIAMDNAQEEVKALADRICPPCVEDGVARTLEELGLA